VLEISFANQGFAAEIAVSLQKLASRLRRTNPAAVEAGWLPVSCRHRQLLLRLVHSDPCVLLLLDRGEGFHAIEAHRHEEIDGTS
jgi:hypothetical protein